MVKAPLKFRQMRAVPDNVPFQRILFFLKLYLRVRTCICNFHFPHGDKCIRGIVHIFVIFSAKYEIFHNLQLLQRTLPSNFTKYKKNTNIPKFAASSTDTSMQLYIVDILTTAISLDHIFLWTILRFCTFFIQATFSNHVFCRNFSLL